jgi:gentisate 1,2-dioxygenase
MKNRPYKPGCYWWEDDCGRYHVAEFDEEMETLDSCDTGFVSPEKFEESPCFKQWLVQAHPPKRVDRYSVGMLPMDLQIKPHEHGPLVLYDDVKEFLLKDDDNG